MSDTGGSNINPQNYGQTNAMPVGTGSSSDNGTGLPVGFMPPPRMPVTYQTAGSSGRATKRVVALTPTGQAGLLARDGSVRPLYDRTREAMVELSSLDDITRRNVQQTLYRKGWYGSRKPGNGYSDSDRNAMSDLLYLSNAEGYTWDVMLTQIERAPDVEARGGRDKPSSADLTEILQRTALDTIGKRLDDKTVSNMVSTYQGVYTGATTETPPSADVFFQNRIEKKYGTENDAHKYLNAISNVAKILGGM